MTTPSLIISTPKSQQEVMTCTLKLLSTVILLSYLVRLVT